MPADREEEAASADARHAEKMRKIQAARSTMMATKTREQGLLMLASALVV